MKFCSKCGKELMDEAVVCPSCGCPEDSYIAKSYSEDYYAIRTYAEQARSLRTLGIFAAIFSYFFTLIGIILAIIGWIKAKMLVEPEVKTQNPNEIAEFECAKKMRKTASILLMIPVIVVGVAMLLALVVLLLICVNRI